MNKASERYNTRVEIPVSVLLETIFSDDNEDVETLSRWVHKYGFVDLIKDGTTKYGYYKLQDDYTKQSFYALLDKEERKQYDYENYLCDENDKLQQKVNQLETNRDEAIEYVKHSWWLRTDQIYDTSKDLKGWEVEQLLSLLERGKE